MGSVNQLKQDAEETRNHCAGSAVEYLPNICMVLASFSGTRGNFKAILYHGQGESWEQGKTVWAGEYFVCAFPLYSNSRHSPEPTAQLKAPSLYFS